MFVPASVAALFPVSPEPDSTPPFRREKGETCLCHYWHGAWTRTRGDTHAWKTPLTLSMSRSPPPPPPSPLSPLPTLTITIFSSLTHTYHLLVFFFFSTLLMIRASPRWHLRDFLLVYCTLQAMEDPLPEHECNNCLPPDQSWTNGTGPPTPPGLYKRGSIKRIKLHNFVRHQPHLFSHSSTQFQPAQPGFRPSQRRARLARRPCLCSASRTNKTLHHSSILLLCSRLSRAFFPLACVWHLARLFGVAFASMGLVPFARAWAARRLLHPHVPAWNTSNWWNVKNDRSRTTMR